MKNNFTRKQRVEREREPGPVLFGSLNELSGKLAPPIQESLVKNRKKL